MCMSHTTNGLLGVVSAGVHLVMSHRLHPGVPLAFLWQRPGLPHLCQISSPLKYFKSAILDARCGKVSADLSSRIGLGDCRFLDVKVYDFKMTV